MDGLPTYLLKKSIFIINQELSNLLTNVDFTVFFDNDLNLKLSSDTRLDVEQNCIQSSGKERTFAALALKMALRKINKKNLPNFILLDEVFGKLINKSVDQFIEFLNDITKEINKLRENEMSEQDQTDLKNTTGNLSIQGPSYNVKTNKTK
jgi:hypothetical protein